MSRILLQDIVQDFSLDKLRRFFLKKNDNFVPTNQKVPKFETELFVNPLFLGQIDYDDYQRIVVYTFKLRNDLSLTNRPGKKAQYKLGKKVLKTTNTDAGIFVFYDSESNFRFSLIYPEYVGTKRKWSYYKRFT